MSNATPPATTEQAKSQVELGKFGGKYGNASLEIYEFLTEQYQLSPSKSHRIAHQFACDHGAAIQAKGKSEVKVKTSRASKEGLVTLRDAVTTTAKGVSQTYPIAIGHAIQWLSDAGKHGVSFGDTDWHFDRSIVKWIEELAE